MSAAPVFGGGDHRSAEVAEELAGVVQPSAGGRTAAEDLRAVVAGLTEQSLAADTKPVEAAGWPESRSRRVRDVLLHLFHEEWEHRLYAEWDLDALETGRQ